MIWFLNSVISHGLCKATYGDQFVRHQSFCFLVVLFVLVVFILLIKNTQLLQEVRRLGL